MPTATSPSTLNTSHTTKCLWKKEILNFQLHISLMPKSWTTRLVYLCKFQIDDLKNDKKTLDIPDSIVLEMRNAKGGTPLLHTLSSEPERASEKNLSCIICMTAWLIGQNICQKSLLNVMNYLHLRHGERYKRNISFARI